MNKLERNLLSDWKYFRSTVRSRLTNVSHTLPLPNVSVFACQLFLPLALVLGKMFWASYSSCNAFSFRPERKHSFAFSMSRSDSSLSILSICFEAQQQMLVPCRSERTGLAGCFGPPLCSVLRRQEDKTAACPVRLPVTWIKFKTNYWHEPTQGHVALQQYVVTLALES